MSELSIPSSLRAPLITAVTVLWQRARGLLRPVAAPPVARTAVARRAHRRPAYLERAAMAREMQRL
jgi:hypothetical protein